MPPDTSRSPGAMQAEFWDGEGGVRWAAAQKQMDAVLAPFADAIFEAAPISAGDVVVDVGCGCGTTTLSAARLAEGGACTGVDISGPMLEVARQQVAEAGLAVSFVREDASKFSVAAGSVDVVISRFGTMFFDDPEAGFTNFRSWLRPGGSLVTTVWNALDVNPWARALTEVIRRHIEVPSPPPGAPGPFAFGDAEAFEVMLSRAGFEQVSQRTLAIPMRIEGTKADAVRFYRERGPITSALEQVGDGPLREAILSDLQTLVDDHYDGQALSLESSARLVVAR